MDIDGQNHPYTRLQIPNDAPFELRPCPGKGWGCFATREVPRGAVILKEKPLFVFPKRSQEVTEIDVSVALSKLEEIPRRQFHCLRNNASSPFQSLVGAWRMNNFIFTPADGGLWISGLFLLLSRFNHSCIPNSIIPDTPGDHVTSLATRDIAAGEEITFFYIPGLEFRTREDRHRRLHFTCECQACQSGAISDMRRTLMRGLLYLKRGRDLDERKHSSSSPLIFDLELKAAAEAFSIQLSSRLIYDLLTVVLLEAEGILDDFTLKFWTSRITLNAGFFQTKINSDLVLRAMKGETWLERVDEVDAVVSATLRKASP